MMKNFFGFLMLAAGLFVTACSDDEEYNADTAHSDYQPVLRDGMVKTVSITSVYDGRDYSVKMNFDYDKQGRIKEIKTTMKSYRSYGEVGTIGYRVRKSVSNAKYYYKGDRLEIAYSVQETYPEYKDWNRSYSYVDGGLLNDNGHIRNYSVGYGTGFYCDYNFYNLKKVVFEANEEFDISRNADGDVNGYIRLSYDENGNVTVDSQPAIYEYSAHLNNTNVDFSALLGYWQHENHIFAVASRAAYQLAAFGFFGSGGKYLPLCAKAQKEDGEFVWEFNDSGLPEKYTSTVGERVMEITYVK